MTASGQFQNAPEHSPRYDAPLQSEETAQEAPPPPHPAVLLGLAFGASAGLFTALYLLIF